MIAQIISGVVGLATGYVQNKAAKQAATHEKGMEIIKSTTNWEELQAKNANNSWKDEWFSLLLSIPFIGAFIPAAVPHIQEGFLVLEGMPDYYKGFLGAAIAASFGIRTLSKWGKS